MGNVTRDQRAHHSLLSNSHTSPLFTMHTMILPVRTLARNVPRTTTCLARATNTSAFSTASCTRQLQSKRFTQPTIQLCKRIRSPLSQQRRSVSSAPAIDSTASTSTSYPESLTWNRFLALRKQRRRISLVASILCAGAGAAIGITVLSTSEFDVMQFGIDPTFVIGGAFIGSALVGWLAGPAFGNAAFNLRYRAIRGQIAKKEKEFYERIKKFRVDPTSSSMQNPVPDYYGEKIGSVTDYRRWLKDQRAFNLKRGKML